jgi:hypothetical protein
LCPSVFAGGFGLSSGRGFESSAPATEKFNSATLSSKESSLSLLTLVKENQQGILHLNTADVRQAFRGTGTLLTKSKTGAVILDVSVGNGQSLMTTDISPALKELLPANVLWAFGQYEVMRSFFNSSAYKIAAVQNTAANNWILRAIGIVNSGTPGILAAGTGLL